MRKKETKLKIEKLENKWKEKVTEKRKNTWKKKEKQ